MLGSTVTCSVDDTTSATMKGRLCSLVARSGPVMNWVKGPALGAKASANEIECVDAAPCDGVARKSVRVACTGRDGVLLVHSCTASVWASVHPRISNTTPLGAAFLNTGVVRHSACECHNCPMRMLVGPRESGRSGRGASGETCCNKCLMVADQRWE